MRTTCSLVAAVWFLAGTALAEAAPATKDVGDAKKLLDLPEASAEEYAQVEGTWELTQDTGQAGKVRRVKTHQGGKTSVTAYSAEGKIVGQHKSEYKLKQSGMARIFVYSKVVPTMGPSEGRELPAPSTMRTAYTTTPSLSFTGCWRVMIAARECSSGSGPRRKHRHERS